MQSHSFFKMSFINTLRTACRTDEDVGAVLVGHKISYFLKLTVDKHQNSYLLISNKAPILPRWSPPSHHLSNISPIVTNVLAPENNIWVTLAFGCSTFFTSYSFILALCHFTQGRYHTVGLCELICWNRFPQFIWRVWWKPLEFEYTETITIR